MQDLTILVGVFAIFAIAIGFVIISASSTGIRTFQYAD